MLSFLLLLFLYCNLLVYMKMSYILKCRLFFVMVVWFRWKWNYFLMREILMIFYECNCEINFILYLREFKLIKVFLIWCEMVLLLNNGLLKMVFNGVIWRIYFFIYVLSLYRIFFYYDYLWENGLIKKIIVGVYKNIIDKGGEKKFLRNFGELYCIFYY